MHNSINIIRAISNSTTFYWNSLIKSQLAQGAHHQALQSLSHMHRTCIPFDNYTFPLALKACSLSLLLRQAQQLHSLVLVHGFQSDVYISNSLVSIYSTCYHLHFATKVFDMMPHKTTITWNSIITGCIRCGVPRKSLSYFSKMIMMSKQHPDSFTMCTILNALAHVGVDELRGGGRAIHGYIIRQESRIDIVSSMPFVENALINMYMGLSRVTYAENVFQLMSVHKRDIVTWTTMITGYMHSTQYCSALALFRSMLGEQKNLNLDPVMLVTVMPALTSPQQGKEIHCFALKSGCDRTNIFVATSLLHMYAEHGNIEYAFKQFERVEERNVVVWTAMITAYAKHGHSKNSLELFNDMQNHGVTPNHLTFMGVLIACSHAGLVDKAKEYFTCMTQEYGMTPDMYHYAALVDVLGRAGRLREALEFIESMPVKPTAPVWGALLASCGLHQEMELGREVTRIVAQMEPENPGNFVFLYNMLAQGQRWDDACMVRETINHGGLRKVPGQSSVHVTK